MRIFNADGSEAEMCGNGIRCLARFWRIATATPWSLWSIETPAGLIIPVLQEDGQIKVDMGAPMLAPDTVPTTLAVASRALPQGELNVGDLLKVAAVGMGNLTWWFRWMT